MNTSPLTARIVTMLTILEKATSGMQKPMVSALEDLYGKDPFLILISCLLSLRAQDKVTFGICRKLFELARSPEELVKIPLSSLEELLHPLGFYRKKSHTIVSVSLELINRFNSRVPSTEKELLSLKGVGRKTANLVLGEGFGVPVICVDTHVHRISNRLGWVKTENPDQTEKELMKVVPQQYWLSVNYLLVMWGQNVCTPLSPWVTRCALKSLCPKIGVKKFR
ncbi:endonuclease III [Candidatus Dependentiae bacterium]|nr:endonuclease III [Candidatus Dependentiae bacterium]